MKHLLYMLLLLGSAAAQGQIPSEPILTTEQLQADFAHFRTALQEAHPAMYRYTPRATFDSLFASTETLLHRPMSRHEFYVTMKPLLVALSDGHIKWLIPGKDEHYPFFNNRLFPLKLYFVEKKAWVTGDYGHSQIPAGAEVLAINGQPMATIIEKLLPNMSFADGTTLTGKYQDLNHFFPGYYATYLEAPDEFVVTYRVGHEQQTTTLPPVSYQDITTYTRANTPSEGAFQVAFDDSTRTAFLTIRRFWKEKNDPDFDRFLALAFGGIRARNCAHLVLDLRNNEGGEESYGVALYRYLARQPFKYYDHISVQQKKPFSFPAYVSRLYRMFRWLVVKKREDGYVFTAQRGLKRQKPAPDAFTGKLYVLINGGSFSVTTEFAARVHADRRATFIGQETSGACEGDNSGIFAITQLPHSKIDLGIPMFGFYMADLPDTLEKGQGIRPDHVVVPSIDDILANHDPVLDFARQLIRTSAAREPGLPAHAVTSN